MNRIVKECIEKVYEKKDYQYFKNRCKEIPPYLNRLEEITYNMCRESHVSQLENEPAIEVWFQFDSFIDQKFVVEYKTLLKISKIADVFVFQHEFCVENCDPNRMSPVLDGFGPEPYTISQGILERTVTHYLESENLHKLLLPEMDEVIENLEIPTKSIFGNQMTIENALFRDLYGLCDA